MATISSIRDNRGRFVKNHIVPEKWVRQLSKHHKGRHFSFETEFKKGIHYNSETEFKKGMRVSPETEFKKGQISNFKGKHHTEETKEKIRQNTIKQHLNNSFPQVNTKIERIIESVLKHLQLPYIHLFNLDNYYVCDFLIGDNLIVECDGDYWHNRPEVIRKDNRKNGYIKSRGYKLLRLWENEIKNNLQSCISKIKELYGDNSE